jgi:hypothetical protein
MQVRVRVVVTAVGVALVVVAVPVPATIRSAYFTRERTSIELRRGACALAKHRHDGGKPAFSRSPAASPSHQRVDRCSGLVSFCRAGTYSILGGCDGTSRMRY